ncbi:MAG: hypothetical protein FWC26_09340 [Fibromonadales bacterium]|nr:hypothetical protein [Fibromonadales bacterium]
MLFIEPRARVLGDEATHLVIAQNFYHNQIGQSCATGSFIEDGFACVMGSTVKSRGLSYIYMLGMPFFGKQLYWVYTLHLFFLAIALLSFYFALLAWLKERSVALLATALLGACPILLFCFRSASVEPIYVTMFCISLLFLKWAYDGNTTRHWLLMALILAFFAQTRPETIFCLFAFIGVVFYRNCPNFKFKTILSQLSTFLVTLSFFSIPILCTLSFNRDSDLQGGSMGARGHLFSNIISNFKIMALPSTDADGILKYPFLPYFTWLTLFGLITLIILTIKEFRNKPLATSHSPLAIPYRYITAFILALSPQYLFLFDSVSADLNMNVQWRFALIILPPMAFLGALFIWQMIILLKNHVNPKIMEIGVLTIIIATSLSQYKTFIKDIPNINNFASIEDYEINKWIRQEPPKRMLFFYWFMYIPLAHGHSAYTYNDLLNLNSEDMREILEDYKGEVYFINSSACDAIVGTAKMQSPNTFRQCDRALRYFNTEEVFRKKIVPFMNDFSIHKILGFNDIDSLGLLRILNKTESTDSTVNLSFKLPKEDDNPWKIQHFVNDSLTNETPYKKGDNYVDKYNISIFNRDTNIWRLDIINTITNEKIHSDFWQLVKTKGN